jgi:hypothetical protein
VPATAAAAEAIAARPNGHLVVYIGARFADGSSRSSELLRAKLGGIPDQDIGSYRESISLSGHFTEPLRAPQVRQLAGVNFRRLGQPRQLRTPIIDFWLKPGDTAVDPVSGLTVPANLITYIVGSGPSMTVSEGAI